MFDNKLNSRRILDIINDLTGIHNLVTKGNLFAAGFNLGSLQQNLVSLMKRLEDFEKENIEFAEDAYEFEEEMSLEQQLKSAKDVIEELNEKNSDLRKFHQNSKEKVEQLESLIKKLIKQDHIYATSLAEVVETIKKTDETEESLYNLLPGKKVNLRGE